MKKSWIYGIGAAAILICLFFCARGIYRHYKKSTIQMIQEVKADKTTDMIKTTPTAI